MDDPAVLSATELELPRAALGAFGAHEGRGRVGTWLSGMDGHHLGRTKRAVVPQKNEKREQSKVNPKCLKPPLSHLRHADAPPLLGAIYFLSEL